MSATADQQRIRFIIVDEDIKAFSGGGAKIMRPYFHPDFVDYNAHFSCDFTQWTVRYDSADAYLEAFEGWCQSAAQWDLEGYEKGADFIHETTIMDAEDVKITGDAALAPKRFRGKAHNKANGKDVGWEKTVIYLMRKIDGDWKVTGMISNLPWPIQDA